MNRENFQKVKQIFQAALDVAPENRREFLNEACAGDKDLRGEVERLFDSYESNFLEQPAVAELADVILENKENKSPAGQNPDDNGRQENFPFLSKGQTSPNTKTTKLLDDTETDNYEKLQTAPDENTLRPSRLRFALVCMLFLYVAMWSGLNIQYKLGISSDFPEWQTTASGGFVISDVKPHYADKLQIGDELVSINNEPINDSKALQVFTRLEPGERIIMLLRRGGANLHEVELIVHAEELSSQLTSYFLDIFAPLAFFLSALGVFLLKLNDKPALLMSLSNVLLAMTVSQRPRVIFYLTPFFDIVWGFGWVFLFLNAPLILHLYLVFPRPSPLVRRFPSIERLIYLPCLLLIMPLAAFRMLDIYNWKILAVFGDYAFMARIFVFSEVLYLCAALTLPMFGYWQASETDKRRIRILVGGVTFAIMPFLLNNLALKPLEWTFGFQLFPS
jgi:hypothetical protein